MKQSATTVDREGWLCVAVRDTRFSDPVVCTVFYPTGLRVFDCPDLVNRPLRSHSAPEQGLYEFTDCERPLSIRLKDAGKTRPEHMEEEPYPCPNVRKGIPTRYQYGRWEKYLKATGWVSA